MCNIFVGEREWFIFTNYLHVLRYDMQIYGFNDFTARMTYKPFLCGIAYISIGLKKPQYRVV